MAIYYPPLKGSKGFNPTDWPEGIIPGNLAVAIAYGYNAQLKDDLYDSNTGWLIIDRDGNPPGKGNINKQPFDQRTGYTPVPTAKTRPTIVIDSWQGTISDKMSFADWLNKNWIIPVGIGLLLIVSGDKNEN